MLLFNNFIAMLVNNAGEPIVHLTEVVGILFGANLPYDCQIFLPLDVMFKICPSDLMSVFSLKKVSHVKGKLFMTIPLLFSLLILITDNHSH